MASKDLNFKLIIDNCRRGDRNSQRALYEHYYGYGLNICLRYASHREEAKEILNDAFLKIFTKLDQYDAAYPFKNWIRRIFANTAIDHYRKGRKLIRTVDLEVIPEIADAASKDPSAMDLQEDILAPHTKFVTEVSEWFSIYM